VCVATGTTVTVLTALAVAFAAYGAFELLDAAVAAPTRSPGVSHRLCPVPPTERL